MIGHDAVTAMRASGWKPRDLVVIDDKPGRSLNPDEADVVFVGGDTPETADMRFAVGLMVHLLADDMSRGVRWADRLLADGAATVIQNSQGEIAVWRG